MIDEEQGSTRHKKGLLIEDQDDGKLYISYKLYTQLWNTDQV